ncbi:MAG TPA: DRTGG domain-containing protein [Feifaniaceae bacterium]|nr:DRTGG domain-containing protein [Feifaniaceae bacterium]
MKIARVAELLDARVLCCAEQLEREVTSAFGADLMSDVLAFMDAETLLLTGLVNAHVIRTAEVLELPCVVFVSGKMVEEDILERAKAQNIVLLSTMLSLYECCGMLYGAGLTGCKRG